MTRRVRQRLATGITRRDRRNASWPTKQRATAWAKLSRSPLDKTRIAPRSPLSVSATERASLCSINTMATSPGVIQFHERVFDRCLHFYERVFRLSLHFYERVSCVFRIFMSEFEAKRPHLVVTPVQCSGHLTGTEKRDAHARPTVQPTAIARIAAADLHEQKKCTSEHIRPSTRATGEEECRRRNPHHRPARRDAALPVRGANARPAGPKARIAAWQA